MKYHLEAVTVGMQHYCGTFSTIEEAVAEMQQEQALDFLWIIDPWLSSKRYYVITKEM